MSETMCKCGALVVKQADGTGLHYGAWFSGECRYSFEPAEPVIKIAPGEPTCVVCGKPDNGKLCAGSYGPEGFDQHVMKRAVPAVPAQEAPHKCPVAWCTPKTYCHECVMHLKDGVGHQDFCSKADPRPPEPQAGAQVPSQDYKEMWLKAVDHGLAQHIIKVRENTKLREELGRVNTHINSIKSYATEAAKTPITRESILAAPQVDEAPIPENLKMAYGMYKKSGLGGPAELIERIAQLEAENRARKLTQLTQSDEMQGFCRLVLPEIGGGL